MEIQELKRTIIEMKKCTKGIQQKIGLTGERISKLEDRDYVIQRTERIKNKEKKNEQNFREMCNTIKEANTCNDSTKRRGTREGPENIFKELMAKNFPNVIYNTHTHIHTHTHTPKKLNER